MPVKADFFEVLLNAPGEVAGLKQALLDGKVRGSAYEGDCACLVGTIANLRGAYYEELDGIVPNSGRPAESWFLGIAEGDTAEKNQLVAITLEWIEEFEKKIALAVAVAKGQGICQKSIEQ